MKWEGASLINGWIRAGNLNELKEKGRKVVEGILVFYHEGEVVALDNRCPHMGFPLHMGSLCDGILTCHWHHARFDVKSGGTLDPWADDATTYPVEVRDGAIVGAGRSAPAALLLGSPSNDGGHGFTSRTAAPRSCSNSSHHAGPIPSSIGRR